jgi:hypothetical protein
MTAMLATQSSKPKGELRGQSGTRVRFADTVYSSPKPSYTTNLDSYSSRPQQPIGRAPPRSVLEYKPPSSFLDAIERPVSEQKKSSLDDFLQF